MVILSSQLFPNRGQHLEDMIDVLHYCESSMHYNFKEIDTTNQSISLSPSQLDTKIADQRHSCSTKKSSHNAYERDRRKKLNNLYSSLRSLLPNSDQSEKLSIPITIGRVLKYIPELQRSIEKLRRIKEMMLRASRTQQSAHVSPDNVMHPIISITRLDKREVIIHICISKKNSGIHFSVVLKALEEKGLHLMSASTFTTLEEKTFYSLHLQTKNVVFLKGENLYEHLMKALKEQGKIRPICKTKFSYVHACA